MRMGSKGLDLVKSFEGLYLKAYKCPANVWTIGYGHTGRVGFRKIGKGMKISGNKATSLLQGDMRVFEKAVTKYVKVPLNQNQFDALVSFSFNVGAGALKNSTLLKQLNRKNYSAAADHFLDWNKGGGRVLAGLTRRRNAERQLFLLPVGKAGVYTLTRFIKDLQKAENLHVTGKADKNLLRKLPSVNAKKNANSKLIKPLKKVLRKKGYKISKINSTWDKELGNAVKNYKKVHGLNEVANADVTFWKKILKL